MAVTYSYTANLTLQLVLPASSAGTLRNAVDNTWKPDIDNAVSQIDAAVQAAFGPNQPKTQIIFSYNESGQ